MSEPVMLKCNHCEAEFLSIYEHECSYEKLKADNKRLREENYQLRIKYENTGTMMDRSVLRAENKKLREALAFYAGESHYELWQERDGNPQTNEWTNDVTYDAGERARKTLEEK